MRNMLTALVAVFMIVFVNAVALADNVVHFTVKVPVDYIVEAKTDSSGAKQLCITGGGALVGFYNGERQDTLTITKDDNILSPEITSCNGNSVGNQCITTYACSGGGCTCTGYNRLYVNVTTVPAGGCVTNVNANCASVVSGACP